jgi:hypothetical protein
VQRSEFVDGGPETPAAAAATATPDEDAFVLPDAWRRVLLVRRGGVLRKPAALDKDAVRKCGERSTRVSGWTEHALASAKSEPHLVQAARAHRAGSPDPLGAAVLAALAEGGHVDHRLTADAWVVEYGLPFAARATLELLRVAVEWDDRRGQRHAPHVTTAEGARRATELRREAADRVRALIAVCDEPTYQAVEAELAACRTDPLRRVAAAYLLPSRTDWVDACCRPGLGLNETEWLMLLCSLGDAGQLTRLGTLPKFDWECWSAQTVATLAEGLDGAAAGVLLHGLADPLLYADKQRLLLNALGELPSDEGFRGLLAREQDLAARPALLTALRRFPVRALRLLAEAAVAVPDGTAARLLAVQVRGHRPQALALLPELPADQAALVERMTELPDRLPELVPAELPAVLADPPWMRQRAAAKPRVLTGLVPPGEPELRWLPGEREQWAARNSWYQRMCGDGDWAEQVAKYRSGRLGFEWQVALFAYGDSELVRPLVADWTGGADLWDGEDVLRLIAARCGLAALGPVLRGALSQPATQSSLLLPFLDLRVARTMADWLVRLKSTQETARSWFARHGLDAARLLVPDAVGPVGAARRAAEQALRLVAAAQGAEQVRAVAADYGAQAGELVGALLSADPLVNALPARLPQVGDWADPAVLPQLSARAGDGDGHGDSEGDGDRVGALPDSAVRDLFTMLALSRPGDPYPGVEQVARRCEPQSLADFGWALFELWRLAGQPSADAWALHALGRFGDDEAVRRLTPIIRAWPGEGAHQRAAEGLEVLAAIGTDTALIHLQNIAHRVKFKALRARAQEKIAEVAGALALTGEQLADRLVPDFGLDPDGSTTVDYGARTFTVGFDEQLRPYVLDADGRPRKDLPAPGAGDDAELAPAERKRFAALKKEVRAVAADQLHRLEAAMVSQRSWTTEEFRQLLVSHPLLRHPVRRLVWLTGADGAAAGAMTAFRITDDDSAADVADRPVELPAGGAVRLAHPLLLGEELAAWSALFAAHGISQPFRQLDRPVYRLTEQEKAGHRLTRFEDGPRLPTGRLLGLARTGWERGEPQGGGIEEWLFRQVGPDRFVVLAPEHGIAVGAPGVYPEQNLKAVWIDTRPGGYWTHRRSFPLLGELDPVSASEVLADLTALTTP